jgi:predicted DCC family thiol-disulfide oxidoreductase YuxK
VKHDLIFFDKKCPFCCACVNFIARIDHDDCFRFAELDGKWSDLYIPELNKKGSVVLLERKRGAWLRGKGALRILWIRGGAWRIFGVFHILPRQLLDPIYLLVVKLRRFFATHHELHIHPRKML